MLAFHYTPGQANHYKAPLAQCSNPHMHDPIVLAFRALLKREGGPKEVARVTGANEQYLYQIDSGIKDTKGNSKGVGKQLRERLERHYPGWLALGHHAQNTGQTITPLTAGEAQQVSLYATRMAPPKLGWEALMSSDQLPAEFETELPDNAMAPEAPRGTRCIFVTDTTPEPGDWVLLRDGDGALYCREYRALRGTHWEAHAVNSAFLPLDSVRDRLRVVAVFDGQRGRKALHT